MSKHRESIAPFPTGDPRVTFYRFEGRVLGRDWVWSPANKADCREMSMSDLQEDTDGDLMKVPYTGWSDYDGSIVERSNCRCFLQDYDIPGMVWRVYGDYGFESVVILRRLYYNPKTAKEWELAHAIDELDRYPCFDDEDMLEFEIEQEDWESWGRADLRRELDDCDLWAPTNDDDILQVFLLACDKANVYHECESAVGGYWDMEQVVEVWPWALTKWADDTYSDLAAFCESREVASWLPGLAESILGGFHD